MFDSSTWSLTIEIPIVTGWDNNNILDYDVYFATESDSLSSDRKQVVWLDVENPEIELTWLEPDTEYFVYVVPVNPNGFEYNLNWFFSQQLVEI